MEIIEFSPKDKRLLKEFVRFSWRLYKDDLNWVPPLNMDLLGNRILGVHGLLTPDHPYQKHSDTIYFMVRERGEVRGRIAATVNHRYNEFHQEKTGFFGFFEVVEEYKAAELLLDKARSWIKSRGMDVMRGPASFSSNETWGLLIDNFEDFPFMDTAYNKKYYKDFLERYGFRKAKDILAQIIPVKQTPNEEERSRRIQRITEAIRERKSITTRFLEPGKFKEEMELMNHIYNNAWEKNWGFVPMDKEEFMHAAENLKIVADPTAIIYAFVKERPAGFIGVVPDVNMMIKREKSIFGNSDFMRIIRIFLRRRKVKRIRLMLLGIMHEFRKIGVDSVLYDEVFRSTRNRGCYRDCEISWLLEDNALVISAGESMGGRKYKTWRIFDIKV